MIDRNCVCNLSNCKEEGWKKNQPKKLINVSERGAGNELWLNIHRKQLLIAALVTIFLQNNTAAPCRLL